MSSYSPYDRVTDGPFTAPRVWHHVLKALIAIALYTALRDLAHLPGWLAVFLASPVALTCIAVKEWNRPSDPDEHSYSHWLRLGDFLTDLSCTAPAAVLWLASASHWTLALIVSAVAMATYLTFRHNARP